MIMTRRHFGRLSGLTIGAFINPGYAQTRSRYGDRVIIVGADILGASIAYHLAKRGAKVTLLDKVGPAAGTTKNSFAWLNAYGKTPRSYYEFNILGIYGWHRLEREIGSALQLQWGGTVQWRSTEDLNLSETRQHILERESWGYSIRLIDTSDIQSLVANVRLGDVGVASFAEQEGTVDPVVAATVLVDCAKRLGATVQYPAQVVGFDLAEGRVRAIRTTQGTIEADYFVLAAGNDLPQLAKQIGITVPLIESKGIVARSAPCPRLLDRLVFPPGVNIKQNPNGQIVASQNDRKIVDTAEAKAIGEDYFRQAAKYFPNLETVRPAEVNICYRVMPKDEHPILGRTERYPNVYVAAQHSGMTCAPIVGQLVSEELLDGVDIDLLTPYRPSRFA